MTPADSSLVRIGVFYDGDYFWRVSDYYTYAHLRKARLSISGLHEFIRAWVANSAGVDPQSCSIVEAHYFRGRLTGSEPHVRRKIATDRKRDAILTGEGVATHYLPMNAQGEKGIDVLLALEAFE